MTEILYYQNRKSNGFLILLLYCHFYYNEKSIHSKPMMRTKFVQIYSSLIVYFIGFNAAPLIILKTFRLLWD